MIRVRQRKYLFIGGPWDGQWREILPYLPVWLVDKSTPDGVIVNYYRRKIEVPGAWVVPIVVYVADPVLPAPTGTPMPGWVQGQVPGCCPIGSWQWISDHPLSESMHALHAAIERRGYRP